MRYPPPLGSRESAGAVISNGLKSDGSVARLSLTVKFPYDLRKNPTSTATRGTNSRWTPAENYQL